MSDNDDKKTLPSAPPAGGPRILAPQGSGPHGPRAQLSTEEARPPGPGPSIPGARSATPAAPVVTDAGSHGRGARPRKADPLPPGASKAPEIRARKKRTNWLPTLLVALLAIGCSIVWFAPIQWPFAFSIPQFEGLFGSKPGPNGAPPGATRQETAAPQQPAAKPAAPKPPSEPAPVPTVASTPSPAPAPAQAPATKEVAAPDDEQKRRLIAAEERLASAAGQAQSDKRTIEGLQTRLTDSERQSKGLQQRIEALEKENGDLRQAARPVAAIAPPLPAPVQPVRPSAPSRATTAVAPAGGDCTSLAARYRNPVTLQFGRKQDVLRADHERQLSQIASAVAACPDVGLLIRGFTDSRGTDQLNVELSQRRANLAARFVEGRGVARNRLSVSGFASAAPLASNDTEAGRARNRRVELTIQPLR